MTCKTSLSYILNPVELQDPEPTSLPDSLHEVTTGSSDHGRRSQPSQLAIVKKQEWVTRARTALASLVLVTVPSGGTRRPCPGAPGSKLSEKTGKRAMARLCPEPGCTSRIVSHKRCVRHGGGSRCMHDGCTKGAKRLGLCCQHGGSPVCLTDGCSRKAKVYGYCWSHGGGRICGSSGCSKVAAQGGYCWAHGGGNRCRLDGCTRRSYQKYAYYCKKHA